MVVIKKKKIKYRVTYLEMNEAPKFDWPKNTEIQSQYFIGRKFSFLVFFIFL